MQNRAKISVVIPTFGREKVLLETISALRGLHPHPLEVVIIDQTLDHEPSTLNQLKRYQIEEEITWIRLEQPSITHAMNVGLQRAKGEIVLFLDDDIIPHENLIEAHLKAHKSGHVIVAGQVLQPGELPLPPSDTTVPFRFNSNRQEFITEFIGCNFSVNRDLALSLGGFDENFVQVAYRYEAEFADRALAGGGRIWFEPSASVRHLRTERGGTRSYGHHLTTIRPSHAVGAYYFLLRSRKVSRRFLNLVARPLRAVRTKHHATHPWWIPATLASEVMGFAWALFLYLRGPRLLRQSQDSVR